MKTLRTKRVGKYFKCQILCTFLFFSWWENYLTDVFVDEDLIEVPLLYNSEEEIINVLLEQEKTNFKLNNLCYGSSSKLAV
jgi:hypothetical protein